MQIMQGDNNWIWFASQALISILLVVAVWYVTIVGRDRNPNKQKRGEQNITRYADVEEDHSPVPKFLVWTYIGFGIWTAIYLACTGFYGLY
jgi:hypothetical protein